MALVEFSKLYFEYDYKLIYLKLCSKFFILYFVFKKIYFLDSRLKLVLVVLAYFKQINYYRLLFSLLY